METLQIDLGKGVVISAPIKMRMTADEWLRMTQHINSVVNMQRAKSR